MQHVIVGLDGSDTAREALRWAVDEVRGREVRLTAVLVAEPPYLYGGELPSGGWDDTVARAREELAGVVDEVVADLPDDVTVEQRVETGDPRRVLRDASRQADHLVVGSRGHGELSGLFLGSVGQYLVTHAECPVTVVRRPGHREP